ncbi:hypothetical protein, partial [Kaarinaea lacus]
MAFFSLLFLSFNSYSAPATTIVDDTVNVESFDHLTTGFPLTGAHSLIDCESCHIGGLFDELPTRCDKCHDGVFSIGVSSNHIPVTENCEVCHSTFGFEAS